MKTIIRTRPSKETIIRKPKLHDEEHNQACDMGYNMGCDLVSNMGCDMGSLKLYWHSMNFIIDSSWFCLATTFALCCACSLLIDAISSSCFILRSCSSCDSNI